jgi:AcrR family transcriptional regulator
MSPRIGLDLPTLLKAATEIADASGIEGVTLAELAKKLTIKTPSLYNHINGLPDLRNKLAIHGLNLLYQSMLNASEGSTDDEAVRALGKAYLSFSRKPPGLYKQPCARQ